jgi:hypothetical protein
MRGGTEVKRSLLVVALVALLGLIALADVPAPPDGEATVIAQYWKWPVGWVFGYDDGRVLWHPYSPTSLAMPLERRRGTSFAALPSSGPAARPGQTH